MDSDSSDEEIKDTRKRSVWKRRATLTQRITSRLWEFDELDPYQIFKVTHKKCLFLRVEVLNGRDISKGFWSDYICRPSPYLILELKGTPNGKKHTPVVDYSCYPSWNICFQFIVDPQIIPGLCITLKSRGYVFDRTIGTVIYELSNLQRGIENYLTIEFQDKSKVDVCLTLIKCNKPDLRFSLSLSKEEIEFMKKRRLHVFAAMKEFLGEESGPKHIDEVPVVAVLNSGGGIRAAIGSSGVYKALHDTGLLATAMYIAGLSGSSWFLTYLYTHPDFPENTDPDRLISEIRGKIILDWRNYITFAVIFKSIKHMIQKMLLGLTVNFADIFGHWVGEMLLGERKELKLSSMRSKLVNGSVPMPLFTCVIAKDTVSARRYQEFVEFSPYEVGLPKYGSFMKTEMFGSKFYVGKIVRHYEEVPLHYLIGVWGSAFSILIKRLLDFEKPTIKLMHGKADIYLDNDEEGSSDEEDSGKKYDDAFVDSSGKQSPTQSELEEDDEFVDAPGNLSPTPSEKEYDDVIVDIPVKQKSILKKSRKRRSTVKFELVEEDDKDESADENKSSSETSPKFTKRNSLRKISQINDLYDTTKETENTTSEIEESQDDDAVNNEYGRVDFRKGSEESTSSDISYEIRDHQRRETYREDLRMDKMTPATHYDSLRHNILERSLNYQMIGQSRAGRAAVTFNPLRGLSLINTYPISPSFEDSDDEEDFQETEEVLEAYAKTVILVDAGLVFNSPYPLLLRPQRAVDVFLSFDYSSRPADFNEAFGELILAEKWAIRNNVTFPPIQEIVEKYYDEPMREVYVFQHPDDLYCPIVVHCIIFNGLFKEYKAPGVKRETPEEFKFSDFKVFSDRSDAYSSSRYTYSPLEFDRLFKLMEFNTLYGMKTFRAVLKKAVKRKRKLLSQPPPLIRFSLK